MLKKNIVINHWDVDDRPREKLLNKGEHVLSNAELLAIILRTGIKGQSAVDVARNIVQKYKSFQEMSYLDISQWLEIKGLGEAKIAQIKAAFEIGRRSIEQQFKQKSSPVKSAEDIFELLAVRMRALKREVVKAVYLDSRNRVIDVVTVEEGTVDKAHPILREVFQGALKCFAVSIILAHNHPSGNPSPSADDRIFTRQLCCAGKVLQVNVLDHIIIGDSGYYSFMEHDEMKSLKDS